MANFLTSLILGAWVCIIALISVQNATPIALRFLTFQSVALPMGVILAFCATLGMVSMAIALPRRRAFKRSNDDF